ncbi:MAG: hypothetical protein ACOCUD_04900 [Bacillota bacterium]
MFNTFFRDVQSKDSSLAFAIATVHGSVYTFGVGVVNLDTLEVNIKEIFNATSAQTPESHSGIVLSDDANRLFYNYNDRQIWDVAKSNIFTGVIDVAEDKSFESNVIFNYLEDPEDNSTQTTGNKTHGTPKYWLNKNQVMSMLDHGSMYVRNHPFFAHMYIFDTISEETIFIESDLNSVYDIKKIEKPDNF